jgi:PIN domain nuclease of toxin-antitoxin system
MILLDTHVLVWLALAPGKLSKNAKQAIQAERRTGVLAISGISLWELAWLVENGRIETNVGVEAFVREAVSKTRVLPITPAVAARAVSFPDTYPKDPQDRIIGATALTEGIALLTHDRLIRKSGLIRAIW